MAENNDLYVRFLGPEDFDLFWPVRLLALRESPEAFGASYEESKRLPPEEAIKRLSPEDGGFVLGAFIDGVLVGVTGCMRQQGLKGRHKAVIWGVYVVPDFRGRGVARAMMSKALSHCLLIDGLEEVTLTVVTTNESALKLYQSLGFVTYGVEPRALKVEDRYYDEALMVLKFDGAAGPVGDSL
jgi:RimJ/RimL family protein N-acetyltransferase